MVARIAIDTTCGARWRLAAACATDPRARAVGFAGRTALWRDEAMLFVFPADTRQGFTLARTGVALDLVFLDADRRVVAIAPGVPAYCPYTIAPPCPYRYALEVPGGWLAQRGIDAGARFAWDARDCAAPT